MNIWMIIYKKNSYEHLNDHFYKKNHITIWMIFFMKKSYEHLNDHLYKNFICTFEWSFTWKIHMKIWILIYMKNSYEYLNAHLYEKFKWTFEWSIYNDCYCGWVCGSVTIWIWIWIFSWLLIGRCERSEQAGFWLVDASEASKLSAGARWLRPAGRPADVS